MIIAFAACKGKVYEEASTPEEALKKFNIHPDFEIEIFAAEPLVLDPVDMAFDESGNVYVVEMPDYPSPINEGKASGSIRVLRDTDKDGRADNFVVFADGLSEATSILPWKGGLLVTAAPNIFYMKDTTGDFKADIKEVLFSGFFKENSEAQITCLRFAPDNWIYANNRGQAGMINFARKPGDSALSVRGADFRFRLDKDVFEPETGPGQFGQTIDKFGHRFFTENTLHIQQSVIPWRYTHRHTFLPEHKAIINISDHDPIMFQETPPPYWRAERTRRRNEQYQAEKLNRVEYAEDHFTGGSGGTIYEADLFGEAFYGNVFTGDVAGNLLHRDVLVLSKDSARFIAKRAGEENGAEFLSTTDSWFRPANLSVGPDGYLYLIDMYRQHIETPMSIPEDLQKDMNFFRGSDQGRIYRIKPKNKKTIIPGVNLTSLSSDSLLNLLKTKNQWWAGNAQRLLLDRKDKTIVAAAKNMAQSDPDPGARLRAIYVLDGLDALDNTMVEKALLDKDANVRENALILTERYPVSLSKIVQATSDSVARVAFQATLTLGNFNGKEVLDAFAKTLERYRGMSWFRTAVLSSNAGSSAGMLQTAASNAFLSKEDSSSAKFLNEIAYIIYRRNNEKEVRQLMQVLNGPFFTGHTSYQLAALQGMTSAGNKYKLTSRKAVVETDLAKMRSGNNDLVIAAIDSLSGTWK